MTETTSSISELGDRLRALAEERGGQTWCCLAGCPGSGKSTVAEKLRVYLGDDVAVIVAMDGFHYSRKELGGFPDPEEAFRRRGSPPTFDGDSFLRALRDAKAKREGKFPTFDHAQGDPVADGALVSSHHRIVLVEGNYLLLTRSGMEPWASIAGLFDVKIFVKCAVNLCAQRLVDRHTKAWSISREEAEERVRRNDLLNAELVVEEVEEERCDVVFVNH